MFVNRGAIYYHTLRLLYAWKADSSYASFFPSLRIRDASKWYPIADD